MMNEAVQTVTPLACLSRSVIGMVDASSDRLAMIACMPGKPKAVKENFFILTNKGVLQHALAQMKSQEKH
jgi:molybdopterin biosynthesis enzyme MoaB